MIYDLIIIGAGPAGVAAAIYAKRANLNIKLLEKNVVGGLLNNIDTIENYPGISKISGPDLAFSMYDQLDSLDIDVTKEEVNDIFIDNNIKTVKTNKNIYKTKNIIITIGRKRNELDIINSNKFLGKGISYCAICDGALYKDKEVCVLGGGDSALQEACYLSNICKKVTIISRSDTLKADKSLQNKISNIENIELLKNTRIKSLNGNEYLESITLDNNENIICNCLFIYIGFKPSLEFLNNLDIKTEKNYILVDKNYMTNIEGIYAAGDIIKQPIYQIVTAIYGSVVAVNDITKKI